MSTPLEIEDSANICLSYVEKKALLVSEYQNKPCGFANLYLQHFEKFKHTCLFVIVIEKEYRNKGIGTVLLEELIKLAKEVHNIEILHLEVYDGNPAIHLYEKAGFKKYGYQKKFIKENSSYRGKILMQKYLT